MEDSDGVIRLSNSDYQVVGGGGDRITKLFVMRSSSKWVIVYDLGSHDPSVPSRIRVLEHHEVNMPLEWNPNAKEAMELINLARRLGQA